MSFNFRLLAYTNEPEVRLVMHEVYYEDDIPVRYDPLPATVDGFDLSTVKFNLNGMKRALEEPILMYGDEFPNEYVPEDV